METIEKIERTWRVLRNAAKRIRETWTAPRTLTEAERELIEFGDRVLHANDPDTRVCDCTAHANDRNAWGLDHEPSCVWFSIRCAPCRGTGWCDECQGDGLNANGRATLEPPMSEYVPTPFDGTPDAAFDIELAAIANVPIADCECATWAEDGVNNAMRRVRDGHHATCPLGDHVGTLTHEEVGAALGLGRCKRFPPPGYANCTREEGHEGPCALPIARRCHLCLTRENEDGSVVDDVYCALCSRATHTASRKG